VHGLQMPWKQNAIQGISKRETEGGSLMSALFLEGSSDHNRPLADL